jgi:hypothetical protein
MFMKNKALTQGEVVIKMPLFISFENVPTQL